MNAYNSRELIIKVLSDNDNNKNDDDEKKIDSNSKMIKLSFINNKCEISIKELDAKLRENEKYIVYIIDYLGKINVKKCETTFEIKRS